MLIQHHTKYKEIDGEDEIVLLPSVKAHAQEHLRLRKAGKSPVPRKILNRARGRSPQAKKYKNEHRNKYTQYIDFFTTVGSRLRLRESIQYSPLSGRVSIHSWFKGDRQELYIIDEADIATVPSSLSSATGGEQV